MEFQAHHNEHCLINQLVLSGLNEGVLLVDRMDIIREVNPVFQQFFNYSREQLIGMSIWDFQTDKDRVRLERILQDYKDKSSCAPYITNYKLKGSSILLEIKPIYRSQEYRGALFILSDITEIVESRDTIYGLKQQMNHLNEQLIESVAHANLASSEALAANKAKDEFLAKMSHEYRTPLNAIIGYCDLLKQELTNDHLTYVNTIDNAAKDLLTLINDLLDYSRIRAGKITLDIREFSLREFINSIHMLMATHAENKGLVFETRMAEDCPDRCRTDSLRLRQCLINLLSNAIKFTRKGHVRLTVDYCRAERMLLFQVEDTGIGISQENQEKIFETYIQSDSSISRDYGGTGLGLAITSDIIKLLHGTLSMSSEPGKGSVFSLRLPWDTPIEDDMTVSENAAIANE